MHKVNLITITFFLCFFQSMSPVIAGKYSDNEEKSNLTLIKHSILAFGNFWSLEGSGTRDAALIKKSLKLGNTNSRKERGDFVEKNNANTSNAHHKVRESGGTAPTFVIIPFIPTAPPVVMQIR